MAMVRRRLAKKHSSNLKYEAPRSDGDLLPSVNLKYEAPWSDGDLLPSVNLKCFSFAELIVATGNFQSSSLLGKGEYGSGTVFKGWIETQSLTASEPGTNIAVAVKRLPLVKGYAPSSEVEAVNQFGRLCHPNLVKLFGYCSEARHSTLVYEFMPHGSLEDHLFGGTSPQHFLGDRIKVALGAAKGLAFFHNNGDMHGLFKPSNILLDLNYNAKLSGFGFAQISLFDGVGIETIYGEFQISLQFINGYTDPISVLHSGFTAKSDVYSFGLVLLEMLWNRRIEKDPLGSPLKQRAIHSRRKAVRSTVCSNGQYTAGDIRKAVDLALSCISMDVYSRPTMDEVVKILESVCHMTEYSITSDV
ncbi:non-specific serine/threonine protein kinase [Ranunculus cassubicifolius]